MPQADLDIYYKLRFTFPHQDAETIKVVPRDYKTCQLTAISKTILNVLVPHFTSKLVYGFEIYNRRKEFTYTHCHVHFISRYSRDTIAKALHREMDKGNYVFKGIKVFSLKPEVYVVDDRIMRYPLKQYSEDAPNKNWIFERCHGYTRDELEEMRRLAHDEWKRCVEINLHKIDKTDTTDTLFSKLSGIVKQALATNDTLKGTTPDLRWIQRQVLAFYVSEEKPLNFTTMSGYAYLLAYQHKIVTEDVLLNKFN